MDVRNGGPPRGGEGGYVCGWGARHWQAQQSTPASCEVALRAPPPLNTPLELSYAWQDGNVSAAELRHGHTLIATAHSQHYALNPPLPPSPAQAAQAEKHCRGLRSHTFPCCFVCGPDREPGDGLRIFAGRCQGQDSNPTMVASRWTPHASLGYRNGELNTEFIWAALDCPGFFALRERAQFALLGSLCATIHQPIHADEQLLVIGWPLDSEGRKHRAGTAIYRGDTLLAHAVATWVSIDKNTFIQANQPA